MEKTEVPQVGEPQPGKNTSPMAADDEAPDLAAPSTTTAVCYFNGEILFPWGGGLFRRTPTYLWQRWPMVLLGKLLIVRATAKQLRILPSLGRCWLGGFIRKAIKRPP